MSETNGRTMSGSTANAAGRPVQAWWVRPDPQKEPLKRLRAVSYYSTEVRRSVPGDARFMPSARKRPPSGRVL